MRGSTMAAKAVEERRNGGFVQLVLGVVNKNESGNKSESGGVGKCIVSRFFRCLPDAKDGVNMTATFA